MRKFAAILMSSPPISARTLKGKTMEALRVISEEHRNLWRIATTKAIAPRKGMRVLDLAAGTGTSSAAIAKHGAHVVAADFSEGMLAEGRKRHVGNDLIEFVFADEGMVAWSDNMVLPITTENSTGAEEWMANRSLGWGRGPLRVAFSASGAVWM